MWIKLDNDETLICQGPRGSLLEDFFKCFPKVMAYQPLRQPSLFSFVFSMHKVANIIIMTEGD